MSRRNSHAWKAIRRATRAEKAAAPKPIAPWCKKGKHTVETPYRVVFVKALGDAPIMVCNGCDPAQTQPSVFGAAV